MYVLHYAPDNASLVIRLALEELGQPYRTRLVDRRAREQEGAAYRALNPAGLIPTLETPLGPVSETAAVLLWLAETHGGLAPGPGTAERPAFLKWLFFASNTLHADLRLIFYPEAYAGPDIAAQRALHAGAAVRMRRHLALLEAEAGRGHSWFNAAAPSALDLYVAAILRWSALYPRHGTGWFDPGAVTGLLGMAARLEARASVAAAARAEGLGPHPFTAPQPCTPPEGSPL